MRWFVQLLLASVASATLKLRNARPSLLPEQVLASTLAQPEPVTRQATPKFLTPQTQSTFSPREGGKGAAAKD